MMQISDPAGSDDAAARPRQTPGAAMAAEDGAEISLLAVLARHRRFIAAMACAGILAAIAYVATAPSVYTARARVYIESRTSPVTARDTPGASTPLEIPEVESQVEYIRSEKLALAAVRRLGLPPDAKVGIPPHPVVAYLRGWQREAVTFVQRRLGLEAAPDAQKRSQDEELASTIREGLEVYRVGAAYVIEIGYSLDDPATAAAIVNSIAQSYVSTQVENRSQLWKTASDWMLQRLNELQERASQASREAQAFKAENAIIDAGRRGLVGEQQVEELNTALAAARTKTMEARALRDQIRGLLDKDIGDPTITTEAFKDGVIVDLRKQYVELQQRADDLRRRFGPSHEAVLALEKDVAAIERSLRAELARLAVSFETDFQVAKAREDSTAAAFSELLSKTVVTSQALVRARELGRSAEAYDSIYTNLLQRYVDAVNQQSYPQASAQIITPASVPEKPSAPRAGLLILLGGLVGTGLGVSGVFGRRWLDRTVRTSEQLAGRGLRCLAILPSIQSEPDYRARYRNARAHKDRALRPADAAAFNACAARYMPRSHFVDGLHGVKTQIFGSERRRSIRTVGITSIGPGCGKTTVSNNLGLVLAPMRSVLGGRSLVVDADLHQGALSRLQGLSGKPGLIDVLAGRCTLDEVLRVSTGGCLVLPAGGSDHNDPHVGDLVTEERVTALLRDSRSTIDRIIFDLPPLHDLSTIRPLVDALDGIVLVVEAGLTDLDDIVYAARELELGERELLGVIVNKGDRPGSRRPRPVSMPARTAGTDVPVGVLDRAAG